MPILFHPLKAIEELMISYGNFPNMPLLLELGPFLVLCDDV